MLVNFKNQKDKLFFVPLGGSSEIGINVNLYHYQGKWLMVDCGSGFADDYIPGVDMVVADLSFIEARKKDLLGIVLTHAHEDHLGAIQYLWNNLECPIYTTKFTKAFLKTKLADYTFNSEVKIIEVRAKEKFDLGPFSIEMVGLTHSAPEMHALMIRTEVGNILHTGDWKFDDEPVVGEASDTQRLKECGDEGVLALVCDSTNVFNKGASGSEGDLRRSLVEIIAGCPKMVVVTTFASNLARLDTLIHAGQKAGRKVCLTGRSLHRIYAAARETGYLADIKPLIDERTIGKYKREELLVIATGCQGEPLAATAKMAAKEHPCVQLAPKDTVIFSSKIIPGNEKKIFRMFNIFVKRGVEVITERDHFVHVSGHPSVEELRHMYELVRPKVCIPVHGEPVHIHEHAKLAKAAGIEQAVEVENGSVVLLDQQESKLVGSVKSGYLAVDGNYLLPYDSQIFRMRRKMRDSGIVVVSLVIDQQTRLVCPPLLSVPGVFDPIEDKEFIAQLRDSIMDDIARMRKHSKGALSIEDMQANVKKVTRRAIKSEVNKSPIVIVNVEEIE
jgi:ribonuclease J